MDGEAWCVFEDEEGPTLRLLKKSEEMPTRSGRNFYTFTNGEGEEIVKAIRDVRSTPTEAVVQYQRDVFRGGEGKKFTRKWRILAATRLLSRGEN